MKIHLVGGFMESGKTTAISTAREFLKRKNLTTALIKDNKVGYVVTKLPLKGNGIPLAKVNGSCSCCSYYELYFQIHSLKKQVDPEIIFAEFSGTCNNLVDSLLKPLREAASKEFEVISFSTFVDARQLLTYLKGEELLLSPEDKYIWERHIKEAEILIVSKIDLLSQQEIGILRTLLKTVLSTLQVVYLNSTDINSVNAWLDIISVFPSQQDSDKRIPGNYSEEHSIAWLDEELEFITCNGSANTYAHDFIKSLASNIVGKNMILEHMQFIISRNGVSFSIDYNKLLNETLIHESSDQVNVMVNARVKTSPEELRQILYQTLTPFKTMPNVTVKEKFISYYQPK